MANIYISSTFQDLREFREELYKAIRRLGHQSVAMEDWMVSNVPPLDRCLQAVRDSDIIIVLVAWRYGWIPPGQDVSLTELEINEAWKVGIPCLVFFLSEDAPWPRAFIDVDRSRIEDFRKRLLERFIVNFFQTPEELSLRVAVALHAWVAQGGAMLPTVPTAAEAAKVPKGPDVFVSYAHEDITMAESIAGRLGKERWSVFWDREIPVGMTWDDIIEKALDAAKCVVVLWSSASRDSEWVRIEANEGAERGILAPVLLEDVKVPLRFRRIQAANLIGWTQKAPDTPGLLALLAAIRRCLATAPNNTD